MSTLKIGMIGLDTSHCPAFTSLLNDKENAHHVPGGKVHLAFPGGSKNMAVSYNRVEGITARLKDEFGVEIVDSIEEVVERSDAILLESVDGRMHLEEFKKIAPFGKPVFIDKPFTTSTEDAKEILALSQEYGSPVFSTSSLRYAAGIADLVGDERVLGAEAHGPNKLLDDFPGMFWYGVHSADMLYSAMGTGCVEVSVHTTPLADAVVGRWEDDRIGVIYGYRIEKAGNFGVTLFKESGVVQGQFSGDVPLYASLLQHVMKFFQTGESPVSAEEMLEVVRFLEAANQSKESGQPVVL